MDRTQPFEIIARHFDPRSEAYRILVTHSILVTRKAIEIARAYERRHPETALDRGLLEEIGLLHDIGIAGVSAPEIGCHGDAPYLRHGVIGREMLEAEGLPTHALACERHTGAGLLASEVREQNLPLPDDRDFVPISIEEKILCVADKFYGKTPHKLWRERTPEKVHDQFERWGPAVVERWQELWAEVMGPA